MTYTITRTGGEPETGTESGPPVTMPGGRQSDKDGRVIDRKQTVPDYIYTTPVHGDAADCPSGCPYHVDHYQCVPEYDDDLFGWEPNLPKWVAGTEHDDLASVVADGASPRDLYAVALRHSGLPQTPRSLALWLSTFCGTKGKSRTVGPVRDNRSHLYPTLQQIGDRTGMSRSTIQRAARVLQHTGWLGQNRLSARSRYDYWLMQPLLLLCPCDEHDVPF